MERYKQQLSFIAELEKLKTFTRYNRTLDGRNENSSEHSWQAAIMAYIFREYYPHELDIHKVIWMLLLHDVGEIYAGDTWLYDDQAKLVSHDKEHESLKKSLSLLPESQTQELETAWLEFEKGNSHEARYARIIDTMLPLINHLHVTEENHNLYGMSATQVLEKKSFFKEDAPLLWKMAKELVQKSVKKGIFYPSTNDE